MRIIQVVLDQRLLRALDREVKRSRRSRSAVVRDALREHIIRPDLLAREERDYRGYARQPQTDTEVLRWESEAVWQE